MSGAKSRLRQFSDSLYDAIFEREESEERSWGKALWSSKGEILTLLIVVVATVSVAILLLVAGSQLYARVNSGLGADYSRVFFGILICCAGVGAHLFKQKNQLWYGIVEIVIGVVSSLAISASMDPTQIDFAKFASLVGAGYVIARGFGNRLDALQKRATEASLRASRLSPSSETLAATPDA